MYAIHEWSLLVKRIFVLFVSSFNQSHMHIGNMFIASPVTICITFRLINILSDISWGGWRRGPCDHFDDSVYDRQHHCYLRPSSIESFSHERHFYHTHQSFSVGGGKEIFPNHATSSWDKQIWIRNSPAGLIEENGTVLKNRRWMSGVSNCHPWGTIACTVLDVTWI